MQRDISDKNNLGDTLNPINDARRSMAINRATSNYNDAKAKVQKIRDLNNMGKFDADLAKYTQKKKANTNLILSQKNHKMKKQKQKNKN